MSEYGRSYTTDSNERMRREEATARQLLAQRRCACAFDRAKKMIDERGLVHNRKCPKSLTVFFALLLMASASLADQTIVYRGAHYFPEGYIAMHESTRQTLGLQSPDKIIKRLGRPAKTYSLPGALTVYEWQTPDLIQVYFNGGRKTLIKVNGKTAFDIHKIRLDKR